MPCKHFAEKGWRWFFTATMPHKDGHGIVWFKGEEGKKMIEEIEAWLETDEAQGLYTCETTWPAEEDQRIDHNGVRYCKFNDIGKTWWFTDQNTAFAFKLRFG
ncbi:MAG: hypothetical protein EOP83_02095 [Verrucomicrobiaceae bacterium]|nr:MAG: hypothetical protein EOP83_02095 [Verrucomicrobiaceae bacterium]